MENSEEKNVTNAWASFFIDTTDKDELLYEDMVSIYHSMFHKEPPEERVKDISDFFAKELKEKINLPDCTLRNAEYQIKILVYLSCQNSCPRQEETIQKIQLLDNDVQQFIFERIKEIDGLVAGHNKTEAINNCSASEDKLGDNSLCNTTCNDAVKKLEESFSNGFATPELTAKEDYWKNKYNLLHKQHIADEAEIQELTERLEQTYQDGVLMKDEIGDLQVQVSSKNSLMIQLEDYKSVNTDLTVQLDKANLNVTKMKAKMKAMSDLEKGLSDQQAENCKIKEELAMAQKLNRQNEQARQELRMEYHEKSRLQVENATLQTLIIQLRAETQTLKQDLKISSSAHNTDVMDDSFSIQPSLADELKSAEEQPNEALAELVSTNGDMLLKINNYEIDQNIMQGKLDSQVEELVKMSQNLQQVEISLKRKSEQLESWKQMHQKIKYDLETQYKDAVHKHRQDTSQIKADLNAALFVTKKELIDKNSTIARLERMLETQKTRASAAICTEYTSFSPSPSTPVLIKKYRSARTPTAIPRLLTPKLTPIRRNYVRDFDDERMEEISKRNQAVAPHLRSTYPVEVQYSDKAVSLDGTGRMTAPVPPPGALPRQPLQKATAFEIPQSPKVRRKRELPQKRDMPQKKEKCKENAGELLQFSPPKPYYMRKAKK